MLAARVVNPLIAPYAHSWIAEFWREAFPRPCELAGFSDCWQFRGSNAFAGYRAFHGVLSHLCAAVILQGEIPSRVVRRCGNRACVRPEHMAIYPVTDSAELRELQREEERIAKLFDCCPGRGHRISRKTAALETGFRIGEIDKLLRKAALYRILFERKARVEAGLEIQVSPSPLKLV